MRRQHVDPNRQINFYATVPEKYCARCLVVKSASAFGQRPESPDGLRDWCNQCGAEYQQKYYYSNLEASRERKRKFMAEQRRDPLKRQQMNERSRATYFLRKERSNKAHREKYAKRFFWARAQKVGSVTLAKALAAKWRSQRGLCALTGARLNRANAHLDHILPRARGGTNELSNLRWVTKIVNEAKRDLTDAEFLVMCGQVAQWIGERILVASQPKEHI